MPGMITQIDVFGDPSDNFVQIKIPVGEPVTGVIEFYQDNGPQGANGREAQLEAADTIDVSTATPIDSFIQDGFQYLSFSTDYSSGDAKTQKAFAVNYADEGVPESTVLFGNNLANRVQFTGDGGTLDGQTIRSLRESNDGGLVEFAGIPEDGLVIGPDGTATDAPTNPDMICFLKGTMILTPRGEVPVETLVAGDEIATADGRIVSVKWIGRQSVRAHGRFVERHFPVKIEEGALGPQLPVRDLFLSPDHAVLLDGWLVNAIALVNGETITQCGRHNVDAIVEYFHIETEDHSVIIADGVQAETFVDATSRRLFDNYDEYVALFGEDDGARMPILSAARVFSARQLPSALRATLAARAAELKGSFAQAA